MGSGLCRSCLSFFLKFLNYLQALVGISIALYSVYVLSNWNRRTDLEEQSFPWFVYLLMGLGLLLCLISCTGYLAAGESKSCYLCFYVILTATLIMFEGALLAHLVLNRRSEQDPHDATGELQGLHEFVGENMDVVDCVSVSLLVFQASLLLALILREALPHTSSNDGMNGDFDFTTKPLLDPEVGSFTLDLKGIRLRVQE
ncbi:Tetraspanin-19 [Apostasia shenzhenica]|uniref:Tetraspanin-19 n=1 Tax=Apostasia shenzhenica TaxID=1088818 RepID=A0A2I0A656_9ASPA|nr:Tetraspanin-19 [Apostasia shenzhenica]